MGLKEGQRGGLTSEGTDQKKRKLRVFTPEEREVEEWGMCGGALKRGTGTKTDGWQIKHSWGGKREQ